MPAPAWKSNPGPIPLGSRVQPQLIVEKQAHDILNRPDDGANNRHAQQTMKEGAMPCHMLDALADDACTFADGAAGVVNIRRQRTEGSEAVENDLHRQRVC